MGLIKAGMGALGGTLADQWKEFFYCDSLDKDVLMVKGQKRTSRRSSNHGEDNIITNGSGIAVVRQNHMFKKRNNPSKAVQTFLLPAIHYWTVAHIPFFQWNY